MKFGAVLPFELVWGLGLRFVKSDFFWFFFTEDDHLLDFCLEDDIVFDDVLVEVD